MEQQGVGALLRKQRKDAGRSQADQAEVLSEISGRAVTRNEVSRWEAERRLPTPFWQQHIAESFAIEVQEVRRAVTATRAEQRKARTGEVVERREFIGAMAALAIPLARTEQPTARRIGQSDIDGLRRRTARLRRLDNIMGSAAGLVGVAECPARGLWVTDLHQRGAQQAPSSNVSLDHGAAGSLDRAPGRVLPASPDQHMLHWQYCRIGILGGDMLGTLDVTADGRFALRFERRFAHSQAKVWRAITETDQLRAWFVEILDYDRSRLDFAEGAKLTYVAKAEHHLPTGHGEVTRIDPPHLLEYTWDAETLRWELETLDDGACRLVFTTIFDDRASAVAVAPGWHVGLGSLTALLDGRPNDRSAWEHLQDDYDRALG